MYATIITDKVDWYLKCDRSGQILVTRNAGEMISAIRNSYKEFSASDYQNSMSACINEMSFKPTVVEIPHTIEELVPMLESESLFNVISSSGSYYGVKLKKSIVEVMISKARKEQEAVTGV